MPNAYPRPPRDRTPGAFPVDLKRGGESSLPVQLAAALRDAIDQGLLLPGENVPATRELAARVGTARGVVVAAYEQLIAEGYLVSGHGRGTTVHPELHRFHQVAAHAGATESARTAALDEAGNGGAVGKGPLTPGESLSDAMEKPAWRAAWRVAAARAHIPVPVLGDARLRTEIAEHLRRMRGTSRSPHDVVVTAGAREGLSLLLTSLGASRGHSLVVGVEDPGYPSLRSVAARHGARVVALPVDADGLLTDALPEGLLDVVIVTPSHQYPLGGSLPLIRRRELIAWAHRTGVVIVEDDYDSELRHTGSPLPALAALDDPERGVVVTLGTFGVVITPALAAGFLLAPATLLAAIGSVRTELGSPVSSVVQVALAEYLSSGELRRHTARLRRRYTERRDLISERLAGLPGVRVRPMNGGLNAVIEVDGQTHTGDALAAATAAGLGVSSLSRYWQRHQGDGAEGLVLGMGGPDEREFDRALTRLRAILRAGSR